MKAATAQINTAALRHNLAVIKRLAPHSKIIAVVKANAYGHGLLPVARTLVDADAYAVARLEEALMLRSCAVVKPIVLLEGFFCRDHVPMLALYNLQTAVHTWEQLEALEQADLPAPIVAWLKLDTGMHRLGVRSEEMPEFIARLAKCKNVVQPFNIMTHFSRADEREQATTHEQIALFRQLTTELTGERALANSAAILAWPSAHADWARPGVILYGVSPFPSTVAADYGLQPAMSLKTQLIAVRHHKAGEPVGYGANWVSDRDTRLGVIAIGYGDGYPRSAPNGTPVLINGRIVPLVGRVSMDMTTVDLGPDANDQVGDEVVLWGDGLPVEQVADAIGTIPYQLITNLTSRIFMKYS
ncbi:alanine racemase [Aeromonas cavernicola]|uniref:Alanine racemase n=1 Tax=Aeromonas cavernicola TaxID=1006623 RepID=A0A2H9U2W6_9GAMM|nr:alanine racemase [Aeromonas cavernicola]PJG58354.1 alanine racemase [Aeromonas cavernicola]